MTDDDTADALLDVIREARPAVLRITSVPTPDGRVVLVVETIDKEACHDTDDQRTPNTF